MIPGARTAGVLGREDGLEHGTHALQTCMVYEPAAGGHVDQHTLASNEQPFSAQRMNAGCSIAGHLHTQNVSHMIRNALQARKTRTDKLDNTTEV